MGAAIYTLRPERGTFDLDAIQALLATRASVVADPQPPAGAYHPRARYLVGVNADQAASILRTRLEEPEAIQAIGYLDLFPERIEISQDCNRFIQAEVRAVVEAILESTSCRIISETGIDVTAEGLGVLYRT